jgi:hypothetical protein
MKTKFNTVMVNISPILTKWKITSCMEHTNKTMPYNAWHWNSGPGFGNAQTCGRVKPVNWIPTSLLHNWMSNGNTYIKCGAQQRYFDLFQAYFAKRGRCGHDRMIVGFTTTYAISAYHHWCCEFEYRLGRRVQHYVTKFVSDFDRLVVFFGSSGFLHQKNWPSHTRYNWNIVSIGVKHHPANIQLCQYVIHIVAVIDSKIYFDVD